MSIQWSCLWITEVAVFVFLFHLFFHVDDMILQYNVALSELLDLHAPMKCRLVALRPAQPWMNDEICTLKRDRRAAERHWRKTGLTVHRQLYKEQCDRVQESVKRAKPTYFDKKIDECVGDQKRLFRLVDKLLGCGKENTLSTFIDAKTLSETFNDFFVTKIANIRTSLSTLESSTDDSCCTFLNSLGGPSTSKLHCFRPTAVSEITRIV